MKSNIKIFTTHTLNTNNFKLENEIFTPIGYQAADFADIPLDNSKYCELCTQYYAWKNIDADYYGFTHYRRFISFSDNLKNSPDDWNIILEDYLNEDTVKKYGLDDCKKITDEVQKYDVISIVPANLKKLGISSVYDQYRLGQKLHQEDLSILDAIVKKLYPDIYPYYEQYMNGTDFYSCNIFIMQKTLFFAYSEFLFSVLKEFENRKSFDRYSVEGLRTPGHLGERLFGAYYTYLKAQNKYKTCDKSLVYFCYPASKTYLSPAFSDSDISIVLSSNESYAPFASAAIQSIIDNASKDKNYDIIVLNKNMSVSCKNMFYKQIINKPNFSIRFYDVGSFFSSYHLYESPTISFETYFRLVIPEILKDYQKVIYLDCDLIVKSDIAELYETNLEDNLIAGVIDIANSGVVNGYNQELYDYYTIDLKMKNPYKLINAGVLVINCEAFRNKYNTKYLLEFAQQGNFKFQDQDLLNIICEDKILYLGPEWNFFADPINSYRGWVETFAPAKLYKSYLSAKTNAKILHYAGNEKPWKYDTCDYEYADEFWTVFIKTPFYGAFMMKNSTRSNCDTPTNMPKKPLLRRLADKLLPYGTKRRAIVKKIYRKLFKSK